MIKKIIKRILKGGNEGIKKKVSCPMSWYGNSYGGFFVNPTLINEESIVYSFGIGEDISFDSKVLETHNCTVYGFDPTPKSIKWINENKPDKFHFYEFGLSDKTGFAQFYLPVNPDYVSGSVALQSGVDKEKCITVEMKTITDIVTLLGHNRIDVLKMDIEGSEYGVIDDLLKSDIFIGQILIEFHSRFFENGNKMTKDSIKKLEKNGYYIFGISESKCEISFINKNLLP